MALSDDDIWSGQQAAPGAAPKPLSDSDIWGGAPAPKPDTQNEGYLGRVGRIAGEAVSDIGEQESKPLDTSNPIATLGDVSGRVVRSGLDMLNAPASIVQGGLEKGYRSTVDALAPNAPEDLREKQARDFGEVSVGPATAAIGEAGTIARTIKEGLEGLATKYVEGGYEPPPPAAPLSKADIKAASDAKNLNYADGISSTIKDATTLKNGLYSMSDEVGNSVKYDASSLQKSFDQLHAKYVNDPAYDATPLVRRLDSWRSMFEPDGSITPTRLNKLSDQIDDAYKENPKAPEGEVYRAIQAPVNSHLEEAKIQFPNWGKLIDTADDANYNLMKYTRDDKAFTDKWSPDSHKDYNITMDRDGNISDTMGATKRQINSITNIKDEAQLQKVMAFMPPEMQPKFLQDVADNSSSPAGIRKIVKGLLQTIKGNPLSGSVNIANGLPIKSDILGWDVDASTHMNDRMTQWREAGRDAYEAHLQDQLEKQGLAATVQRQYATQPRALPAPNTGNRPAQPLALPAPQNNELVVPRQRPAMPPDASLPRKPTQAEYEANIAMRQNPDMIAAQRARAEQTPFELGHSPSKRAAYNVENPNMDMASRWEAEKAGIDTKGMTDEEIRGILKRKSTFQEGFARGGTVNTKPTEAQKAVGNYKKGHIKLHGLDITIENPKGSERSGVDKNGRAWKTKMPVDYGYIRSIR